MFFKLIQGFEMMCFMYVLGGFSFVGAGFCISSVGRIHGTGIWRMGDLRLCTLPLG